MCAELTMFQQVPRIRGAPRKSTELKVGVGLPQGIEQEMRESLHRKKTAGRLSATARPRPSDVTESPPKYWQPSAKATVAVLSAADPARPRTTPGSLRLAILASRLEAVHCKATPAHDGTSVESTALRE
mmetsp:Transcript_30331/g.69932  ORF Transcript_30331/g.69932 Transcript_30331/m.69932 type:complete len:129 (+) Transcript_30331:63-449(+)